MKRDEEPPTEDIALDAFERFCDLDIVVANDLAVAAVEGDASVLDLCDHAEAVILILEYPTLVVERGVSEGGKHRLQAFWQCGGPGHYDALPSMTFRNVTE